VPSTRKGARTDQGNRMWVLGPLCCPHSRASGNDRGEKGNSLAKCDCHAHEREAGMAGGAPSLTPPLLQ
jgi:hypothetical protein